MATSAFPTSSSAAAPTVVLDATTDPVQNNPLAPAPAFPIAKIDAPSKHLADIEFDAKEQQEIAQIAKKIDPSNMDSVYAFGQEPTMRISSFSDSILQMSKGKDIGEFGSQLGTMVNTARSINFQGVSSNKSQIPLIGGIIDRFRQKAGDIKTQFDSVATQIETTVKHMDITEKNLDARVKMLEQMFSLNKDEYRSFSKYLVAGQAELIRHQAQLTMERSLITADTDAMEVQRIGDYGKFVERLDKRLHDLQIAKVICVQTATEIRMIQSNSRDLIGQYKDIKSMTIPAWKKQLTLYLANSEQQIAAKTATAAKDFTNELLVKNAEMLGTNSVAIAENNQRALVDVATLEKVNNSLVEAFTKTQQIEEQGRTRRAQEAVRLTQLADELKARLREAGARV
jgi:uncharacterized protein YaaN involved in tellurite resistance